MAGCFDLLLKIDGVDRTDLLIHETLLIDQSNDGLNSTCVFDLLDQAVVREDAWTVEHTIVTGVPDTGDAITGYLTFFPQTKVDVCITNVAGTVIYFAGLLARLTATHMGAVEIRGHVTPESEVLRCECVDYNQVLEEMVIDDFREYGGLNDQQLIVAVFDEFVAPFDDPYDIDYATFVTAVPHAFDIITFDSVTVRQFMDTLCSITGAVWYVDYERKLHYKADEAKLVPPWHLSDVPDGLNSFAYFDDISKEKDATNLVNRVFVVGGPVSLWFTDPVSIATYGSHRAIVRDTSLIDIDDIEDKGLAILEKLKDPIVIYRLKTYKGTPGGDDGIDPPTAVIRAGQHIRVVSAFYDLDEAFLINNLTITFPVDGTPVYEITCGGLDSSASASATRSIADAITVPNITPSTLPIAARGWGHDLEFSATDANTVEWTVGTITTADGQEFDIAPAADTGDMGIGAVTYVYLDTSLSLTALQHSVNAVDSIGLGKILIAVCAPDDPPGATEAMYQVFGGGAGTTLFLHADNIAANCITANEIYGNTLSVIVLEAGVASMGLLNAGEIRMIGAAGSMTLDPTGIKLFDGDDPDVDNIRLWLNTADGKFTFRSAVVGNPHISIDNERIAGYNGDDPAVLQFELRAADGRAYAGAGAVVLDAGGVTWAAGGAGINFAKWESGADIVAIVYGQDGGVGTTQELILRGDAKENTSLGRVLISGTGVGAGNADLLLISGKLAADNPEARVDLDTVPIWKVTGDGVRILKGLYVGADVAPTDDNIWVADDVRIGGGLVVGSLGDNPAAGYARVDKGLYVGDKTKEADDDNIWCDGDIRTGAGGGIMAGSLVVNPDPGDVWCDGRVSTDGGTTKWELGGQMAVKVTNCTVRVWINGAQYYLLARQE